MSGTLQVLLRVSFEGQATPPSLKTRRPLSLVLRPSSFVVHGSWRLVPTHQVKSQGPRTKDARDQERTKNQGRRTKDHYRPAADAVSAGFSCSMLTGRRNGIIARSRTPTASIGCARSACRVALKCGRPALCSATHARAYSPLLICSSITFISRRVASVTMRGPPV